MFRISPHLPDTGARLLPNRTEMLDKGTQHFEVAETFIAKSIKAPQKSVQHLSVYIKL